MGGEGGFSNKKEGKSLTTDAAMAAARGLSSKSAPSTLPRRELLDLLLDFDSPSKLGNSGNWEGSGLVAADEEQQPICTQPKSAVSEFRAMPQKDLNEKSIRLLDFTIKDKREKKGCWRAEAENTFVQLASVNL